MIINILSVVIGFVTAILIMVFLVYIWKISPVEQQTDRSLYEEQSEEE